MLLSRVYQNRIFARSISSGRGRGLSLIGAIATVVLASSADAAAYVILKTFFCTDT